MSWRTSLLCLYEVELHYKVPHTWSHHRGAVEAVDLGDPETELVGDVLGDGGDGEVDVLEADLQSGAVGEAGG